MWFYLLWYWLWRRLRRITTRSVLLPLNLFESLKKARWKAIAVSHVKSLLPYSEKAVALAGRRRRRRRRRIHPVASSSMARIGATQNKIWLVGWRKICLLHVLQNNSVPSCVKRQREVVTFSCLHSLRDNSSKQLLHKAFQLQIDRKIRILQPGSEKLCYVALKSNNNNHKNF